MYYYLVSSLKRRLILELQDSFSFHPIYRKVVPYIQNRFSFAERPQMGIVVKGSSANKVQFSPDNYVGTIESHVMLAYVGQPTYPIEWVREDLSYVESHGGLGTLPGVYYLEVLSAPTNPSEPGYFVLDPMMTVTDEALIRFQSGIEQEAQLQQIPLLKTLRIYVNNRFPLIEGKDFTADYTNGKIALLTPFNPNDTLSADYRYASSTVGPIAFYWNTADYQTLPGVVLAFGKRAEQGQKVAVVVYQTRVDTAQAFGGKFEASFDLDVIARDTTQMEEIADLSVMYLWGQKKSRLESEGIEIVDISIGGEAEEPADETGDEFFYTASLSIQLRADWEIHVPLPLTISRVTPTTQAGDFDPTAKSGIQAVQNDLFFLTHPIIAGRNNDYERIT
jgi:hypothetical protein